MVICSICQFEITKGYTPQGCGNHGFHHHCLQGWIMEKTHGGQLQITVTCPVCRQGDSKMVQIWHAPPPSPLVVPHPPVAPPSPQPGPSRAGPSWHASPQAGPSQPRPVQGPPQGLVGPFYKTCHVCGMPCRSTSHKSKHLLTHSGPYYCEYCGARYNRPDTLQRHKDQKHFPSQ